MTLWPILLTVTLFASVWIMSIAFKRGSWALMWLAAFLSLAFSIVTGLTIGPFAFLLTCMQFAAAIALRWHLTWRRWMALSFGIFVLWFLLVPVQLILDVVIVSIAVGMAIIFIGAAIALSVPRRWQDQLRS